MASTTILQRRRRERERLLEGARDYVAAVRALSSLHAAVVFGSVARGDFNVWSDLDLLLLFDALPDAWLDRQDLLPPRPPAVQPILWTIAEWRAQLQRKNPIACEAAQHGIWLSGQLDDLLP
ncbi:MAG: nucleotidyltransferase domain-containing protein, partial [Gemmatimonadota bacterium]